MRKPIVLLTLLGLGLSGITYAQGVYRYEKNGKVYYSDQPPPSVNAKQVDTHVPGAPRPESNTQPQKNSERQAIRSQECDKARARLVEYQNSPIIKQRNLKGEERELTAAERIDVIVRAQTDVNELCGPAEEEDEATDSLTEENEAFDEGFDETPPDFTENQ